MKILNGAITYLAGLGHATLQIPEAAVMDNVPEEQVVRAPDEWFCRLKDGAPSVGLEGGFLHLTRTGYKVNKQALLEAYESAGGNPADFEAMAEKHFKEVGAKFDRKMRRLKRKLAQLERFRL